MPTLSATLSLLVLGAIQMFLAARIKHFVQLRTVFALDPHPHCRRNGISLPLVRDRVTMSIKSINSDFFS